MKFEKELQFIKSCIQEAYAKCFDNAYTVSQKTQFDLVTDVDLKTEQYISQKIRAAFPGDLILGEEYSSETSVSGRVWSIDPIDGTCNMANGIKLYGVQCALIVNAEPVVSAVYLPHFDELIYAVKGQGCYCNGERVFVSKETALNNAIVSFGDYPHKNTSTVADLQHAAIKKLYPVIAKIRMFGAACLDFSLVAQGRTQGTVVITKNVWDVAPGVLLCREAGAIVTNLKGMEYKLNDDGVIVACNSAVSDVIIDSFKTRFSVGENTFEAVIFDFDGVILDSEKFHYLAWKKAFASVGFELTEDVYEGMKSTGRNYIFSVVEAKLGRTFSEETKQNIGKIKDETYVAFMENMTENDFIPGAIPFLSYLKQKMCKVGVASSSKMTGSVIEKFDLKQYFDVVLDGKEAFNKKPAPDIFIEAARRLAVEARNCLVFEDSLVGIQAAQNAGMQVISVGRTSDGVLTSVKDLSQMSK